MFMFDELNKARGCLEKVLVAILKKSCGRCLMNMKDAHINIVDLVRCGELKPFSKCPVGQPGI